MTTENEKPFWQRPLPPIKRPGEAAVMAVSAAVVELPPESAPAAMDGGAAVPSVESAPAPEETRPAAHIPPHIALQNAVNNLDAARWRSKECRRAVAAAREAFSSALAEWNKTLPIQTVLEAKMDVIRTNQMERERKAAHGLLHRPMTISETAKAMSGGNRRAGGGAAYKRNGTFTRAEAAKINMNRAAAQRMAGSAAPRVGKLPSER